MNPAEFITDFKALDVSEGQQTHMLQLIEPLTVYSGVLDKIITVPKGFTFDGESIPVWLHGLVPPFGQSKRGACVHDYLYRFHGFEDHAGQFHPVTRAQADAVYKELVQAKGLPSWRANVRWGVLRLVGWVAWSTGGKSAP
jgi:hypothetical protein